jgi:hypothetical protein
MNKSAPYLKRLAIEVVLGLLIISLAACGNFTSTTAPGSPTQTGSPPLVTTAPTTPPISNTAAPVPTITTAPSPSLTPIASAIPSVVILAPADFAAYHTAVIEQGLRIAVQVSNFKLVDKIGQAAVLGEGHLIYYVNADPPTAAGVSAVSPGGSYLTTTATAIVWGDLPKGAHRVAVQLVNNDNTPLSPPVVDSAQTYLNFVVGAPNIKIISPGVAATLPAGNITVQVAIRDFINVYNPTKANINGEGHIVYYMDADPPFVTDKAAFTAIGTYNSTAATSYTWQNVTPGVHTFSVQLVTNDSSPLSSAPSAYPAVDKVEVIVK